MVRLDFSSLRDIAIKTSAAHSVVKPVSFFVLLHTGVWSNDTTGITDLRPLTDQDWKTTAKILMSTPGLNNGVGCMLGFPSIAASDDGTYFR